MKSLLILPLLLISFFEGFSQVKLPGVFGDHMVIQRNQRLPVWGWSSPGEKITISFNRQTKETTANKSGKWILLLDPEPAGGPFDLSIKGNSSLVIHDVLVGEVWICSGQSNMEFEVKFVRDAESEINSADIPEIRHIKIPLRVSSSPMEDIPSANWNICSPKTVRDFTAVGYFFARELVKRLHVPVGLINTTWGGTMVESWTSRQAFEKDPEFKSVIAAMDSRNIESLVKERQTKLEAQIHLLQKNIHDSVSEYEWKNQDYNSQEWPNISVTRLWENQSLGLENLDGIVWYRKEIMLDSKSAKGPVILSLGKIDDNDETFVNGIRVGGTRNYAEKRMYHVPAGIFKPGKNLIAVRIEDTGGGGGFYDDSAAVLIKTESGAISLGDNWTFRIAKNTGTNGGIGPNDYPDLLFNAMINPLIPFGIRGAIWYQGEQNADRAYQYRNTFPLMIKDWRAHWNQGNFPFYFVQLAGFKASEGNSNKGSSWAELREAQTRALSLPATGMAVAIDIGETDDIHPKNKQDVGKRLSAIALDNIYGQPMEFSGPVYESMDIQGNKFILRFTHTGTGLLVKDRYGYIRGFEIAGQDHQFHYAKAFLQNNQVIVYSDEVQTPLAVRYAWADDAGDANLYNQEGFPAVPFRTDQWKGLTDNMKFVIGHP